MSKTTTYDEFLTVEGNNDGITNTKEGSAVTPSGSGATTPTVPTFTPGWNKDATEYTDGAGELWHWKNEQLYNSNDISWEDVQAALKARGLPGEEAPTRPLVDVTPTVTQPIGYGSYLSGANGSGYGEYLANAGKGVQAGYDQAVAAARRGYEQGKATYGASGESLARAGLTGSGYGDYLEGKAFSAMQQNIGAAERGRAQSYADYLTSAEQSAASLAEYLAGQEAAAKEKLDLAINGAITSAIKSGGKYVSREELKEYAAQKGVAFDDATMAIITDRLAAQGITVADKATVDDYNMTAAAEAIATDIHATGAKMVSEEDIAALVMKSTVPVTAEAIKSALAGLNVTVKPSAEIENAVPTGFGADAINYWMNEFYTALNSISYGNNNASEQVKEIIDKMVANGYDKNVAETIKNLVLNEIQNPKVTMDAATTKIYDEGVDDLFGLGNLSDIGLEFDDKKKQAEVILNGMLAKGVPEEKVAELIDIWNAMYPDMELVDFAEE